jgi:uncharacterized lipoprotein YehR (DUF1307 family)
MKKLKSLAALLCAAVTVLALTACGNTGVYKAKSITFTLAGASYSIDLTKDDADSDPVTASIVKGYQGFEIEITKDKLITRDPDGIELNFNYKMDGINVVFLNNSGDEVSGTGTPGEITIDKGELTWKSTYLTVSVTIVFKK